MKKNKNIITELLVYIILIATAITVLFPIFYVIASSFKTNMELMAHPEYFLPQNPTFDNYIKAWNADTFNVSRLLFNSIWYTCISVTITLISSTVCGYVFARGIFKFKKLLFGLFSSLMFVSLGSITVYPLFEVLSLVGLNKSLFGLIVVQCFGIPVVNMYLVRGFINSLPKEMDEAATIDGCTFTGIFVRVILPLLKPIVATIGVLSFQSTWNSYLMPSIFTMSSPKQQTLMVGLIALKNSGEGAASWNLMFAGTTIAIIPILVAYSIGSKYFTSGIVAGAVKG